MSIEKIISENLNVDINSITDDSHFVNDLGADSLNIVEVVMGIEQEFEIDFEPGPEIVFEPDFDMNINDKDDKDDNDT